MIDIHNHMLINVDDGPASREEVLDLLEQAVSQGITDVFATPHHQNGPYINPRGIVEEKIEEVRRIVRENGLDIRVHPGQEIRINEDITGDLQSGFNMPLNDTHYVLVEFSFTEYRDDTPEIFASLMAQGYTPIIAHPERYATLIHNRDKLKSLVNDGAKCQLTAGSVLGEYGPELQEVSFSMIEDGLIHIIASDAHHAGFRPFMLKEALKVVEDAFGPDVSARFVKNAEAVLDDESF